jgi:hypothetical protein
MTVPGAAARACWERGRCCRDRMNYRVWKTGSIYLSVGGKKHCFFGQRLPSLAEQCEGRALAPQSALAAAARPIDGWGELGGGNVVSHPR